MRATFHPFLPNGLTGDPVVWVDLIDEDHSLLVDLGDLRAMPNWGWMFTSGTLALFSGALIWWMSLPSTASWLTGLLIGITLLFRGWSMAILGLSTCYLGGHEPIAVTPEMG